MSAFKSPVLLYLQTLQSAWSCGIPDSYVKWLSHKIQRINVGVHDFDAKLLPLPKVFSYHCLIQASSLCQELGYIISLFSQHPLLLRDVDDK